jgi:hypothetical protein
VDFLKLLFWLRLGKRDGAFLPIADRRNDAKKPSPRDGGVSYMNRTTPKNLRGDPQADIPHSPQRSACREFQRLHAAFVA